MTRRRARARGSRAAQFQQQVRQARPRDAGRSNSAVTIRSPNDGDQTDEGHGSTTTRGCEGRSQASTRARRWWQERRDRARSHPCRRLPVWPRSRRTARALFEEHEAHRHGSRIPTATSRTSSKPTIPPSRLPAGRTDTSSPDGDPDPRALPLGASSELTPQRCLFTTREV